MVATNAGSQTGGINLGQSNKVDVGGDVVGRDKNVTQHIAKQRIINVTGTESAADRIIYNENNFNIGNIFNSNSWTRPNDFDTSQHRREVMVGRTATLQEVHQRLHPPGVVQGRVALFGLSGIGKSTIAAAYAQTYGTEENYPAGVLWTTVGEANGDEQLRSHINRWARLAYPKDFLPSSIAEDAEFSFDAAAVRHILRGHGPLLVILDDVRRLESIDPLLHALPENAFIILTTQDREIATTFVEPSRPIELGKLELQAAITLLRQYIEGIDDQTLAGLARAVEAHPQTLRLLAPQIGGRSTVERRKTAISELIEKIRIGKLESPIRLALDFAYAEVASEPSYGQVGQRYLRLMGLLCPSEADVSTELLAHLWETTVDFAATFIEEVLTRRAWVTATGEGRWAQHALMRAFLRGCLDSTEEAPGLIRYCEFALKHLERIEAQPESVATALLDLPHLYYVGDQLAEKLGELAHLSLDRVTAQQVIDHTIPSTVPEPLQWLPELSHKYAIQLTDYVFAYGDTQAAITRWSAMGIVAKRLIHANDEGVFFLVRWYQACMMTDNPEGAIEILYLLNSRIDTVADLPGHLYILSELGSVYRRLGNTEAAIEAFEQAIQVAEQESTPSNYLELQINLYVNYAEFQIQRSQFEQARRYLLTAETMLVQQAHEKLLRLRVMENLSLVYSELGEYESALKAQEEMQAMLDQSSNVILKARVYNSTGYLLLNLGQLTEAHEAFTAALALCDKSPIPSMQVVLFNNLANVALRRDNPQEANTFIKRAEELLGNVHDKMLEARTIGNLGLITYLIGEQKVALAYLERSLSMLHEVQETTTATQTIAMIAKIYQTTGQASTGIDFFKQLLPTVQKFEKRNSEVAILSSMALLSYAVDNVQSARQYLEQASEQKSLITDPTDQATVLTVLADTYMMLGEIGKAVHLLKDALFAWRQTGNQLKQSETLLALGFINYGLRDLTTAQEYLDEVSPLIEKASSLPNQAGYHNVRGLLCLEKQQIEMALKDFEQSRKISEMIGNQEMLVAVVNNIAYTYLRSEKLDLALREYEQLLVTVQQLDRPDLQSAILSNLGMTHLARQDIGKAKANIQNAIEVLTSNGLTTDRAGQNIEFLRFILTLLRYADKDHKLENSPTPYQALSILIHSTSKRMAETIAQLIDLPATEADRWFQKQISGVKDDPTLAQVLRLYRSLLGQTPKISVAEVFAQSSDRFECDFVYHWWGRLHLASRGYGAALTNLNRAVELAPKNSRYYTDRGWAYRGLGDYQASMNDFEQAILCDHNASEAYVGRSAILFERGDMAAAVPELSRVLDSQRTYALAYQWRGTVYLALDDTTSAIQDFADAIKLDKERGDHYYWRALTLLRKGDYPAALEDLNQVYELDSPDSAERVFTILWRSVVHELAGQLPYALANRKNAEQTAKGLLGSFQQHLLLAFHAVLHERKERAYEEYQKALSRRAVRHAILTQIRHLRLLIQLFPTRRWLVEVAEWLAKQA